MGWKKQASSNKDFDRELPPAGNHPAVLVALVDVGTHEDSFGGKVSHNRKVYLCWELTALEGNPVIGRDLTFSLNAKALLRQWLAKWRGKDLAEGEEYDVSVLVGKPCLLTVEHQAKGDKTYAKVSGVAAVPRDPKGKPLLEVPAAAHDTVLWSIDDEDPFTLPEWLPYLYGRSLQEWADDCQECKGDSSDEPDEEESTVAEGTGSKSNDPIPF